MTSIEEAIGRWLRTNKVSRRVSRDGVFSRWKEVVGEELAARTRPIDLRGGELLIEVDSAPLLHELATYFSAEILESLHQIEEFRTIHALRFRAAGTS
jgi:hypothetical protein